MIEFILLLTAFPVGFLIAWFSRDELANGRKWLKIIMIVSAIFIIGFWLTGWKTGSWTFGYLLILALVGLMKSHDRKWTKAAI
ncbi:hypothetical protein CO038_00305 [Candidatus Pacearchaeota archaeon CG_4_9_14_0_2_um_filter_39_13]|nr:hypothetical protein [Candidatus Pacearchaeota archaeon]OIO44018.1 MAG: hypothetical protein AUJ64_00950 [Candidatus Pacearchaeota archaeon CG1_02_39_14]PJC45116.1 MAG: hypothetical protein CO038_00305 [Candidatus Pacearchaeota archaeon CG_4_9_14_0_2_um_filter_39_13]